jgi:hypothetical protein
MGIFGVMDHAIGNDDIGNSIGERKAQVVRDSPGAAIPAIGKLDRDTAAVDTDAAETAVGEKSKDSSWTAANIEDKRR